MTFGRPNFGGGGGSTWLGQIPNFFQKFDLKAPLSLTDEEERTAPLCQGGEEMEGNASDLTEFEKLVIDYYLDSSIQKEFMALKAGFQEAVNMIWLGLVEPKPFTWHSAID